MKHIAHLISVLSILGAISTSCDQDPEPIAIDIRLYNETNDSIEVFILCGREKNITQQQMAKWGNHSIDIAPYSMEYGYMRYRTDTSEDDTYRYQIMVLTNATSKQYTKEEILNNNIHDAYYNFSSRDIENMGYKFVYNNK